MTRSAYFHVLGCIGHIADVAEFRVSGLDRLPERPFAGECRIKFSLQLCLELVEQPLMEMEEGSREIDCHRKCAWRPEERFLVRLQNVNEIVGGPSQ